MSDTCPTCGSSDKRYFSQPKCSDSNWNPWHDQPVTDPDAVEAAYKTLRKCHLLDSEVNFGALETLRSTITALRSDLQDALDHEGWALSELSDAQQRAEYAIEALGKADMKLVEMQALVKAAELVRKHLALDVLSDPYSRDLCIALDRLRGGE